MIAVVLAGGSGTRLWPMSREARPKQFSQVISDDSLIRDTYRRLLRLLPQENIYFSISPGLDAQLHEEFPEVPNERVIIEPERRDTGPAMGYAAAILELTHPDETIVFVPADHYIGNEEMFLRCLEKGDMLVQDSGKLLDIGVTPTFPSTALGYTKIGNCYEDEEGICVFEFAGHTEKPPYDIAKQYLEDGSYLWHANYYMWTPSKFLEAIEKYAPEMGKGLRVIQDAVRTNDPEAAVAAYASLPKISFDYAVTEKMDHENVLIIRGDFEWSDIGTWDRVHEQLSDTEGNVTKGHCVLVDTKGSLIYAPEGKTVSVVGLDDVVVVDSEDALLVCKKEHAARTKEIVSQLRDEGMIDRV